MTQIVILKVDMCIDETIIGENIPEESHVWQFSWQDMGQQTIEGDVDFVTNLLI